MRDREFLKWLHARLEHVHNEPHDVDYMGKLRSIISVTPHDRDTPNIAPDINWNEGECTDAENN